ncbi:MAG: hypothetical protein HUJ54_09475, partial [Erysipelotrichaceae bacterium]|nr:hypothetical protein [Erysipelotrichaceae bacterium]
IAGNMAKYRFGKLMTLKNDQADGVILLHSAEENAAVILKILTEKYKDALPLPVLACDLDREHRMGEDELALFMNWL